MSTAQRRASTSRADVPAAATLGRVHFIAIGGAGMSGVARVMLARGMPVTGSRRQGLPGPAGARGRGRRRPRRATTPPTSTAWTPWSSPRRSASHNVELAAARARGAAGAAPRPGPGRPDAGPAPGRRRRGQRQDHDDVDAHRRPAGTAALDPSFAVGGELAKHGTNAHHGTGDGVRRRGGRERRLVPGLPARGRDRHQRPARPPRLLRHLRGGAGRPTRGSRARSSPVGCWSPAPTTRARARWPSVARGRGHAGR